MFCINCGNKIDDDAKFCPQCGASTEDRSASLTSSATLSQLSDISKIRILNIATICCLIFEVILIVTPLIEFKITDSVNLASKDRLDWFTVVFSGDNSITVLGQGVGGLLLIFHIIAVLGGLVILTINIFSRIAKLKLKTYNDSMPVFGWVFIVYITALIASTCLHGNCLTVGETFGWLNVSLSPTMYILLITDLALFVIRRIGRAYNEVNTAE